MNNENQPPRISLSKDLPPARIVESRFSAEQIRRGRYSSEEDNELSFQTKKSPHIYQEENLYLSPPSPAKSSNVVLTLHSVPLQTSKESTAQQTYFGNSHYALSPHTKSKDNHSDPTNAPVRSKEAPSANSLPKTANFTSQNQIQNLDGARVAAKSQPAFGPAFSLGSSLDETSQLQNYLKPKSPTHNQMLNSTNPADDTDIAGLDSQQLQGDLIDLLAEKDKQFELPEQDVEHESRITSFELQPVSAPLLNARSTHKPKSCSTIPELSDQSSVTEKQSSVQAVIHSLIKSTDTTHSLLESVLQLLPLEPIENFDPSSIGAILQQAYNLLTLVCLRFSHSLLFSLHLQIKLSFKCSPLKI